MKASSVRWAVVALTAVVLSLPAAATDKPAPSWLKIIDQGDLDPRLKGYKTPEGIKVEIVAENPVVVNPVGMAFADDGTPYVLEERAGPGDENKEKTEPVTRRSSGFQGQGRLRPIQSRPRRRTAVGAFC